MRENGDVIVKAPLRLPLFKINDFIQSKGKWIYEKHIEQKNKYSKKIFKLGDNLKVLGKEYKLEINNSDKKQIRLEFNDDKLVCFIPEGINESEKKDLIEKAYDKLIIKIANKKIPEEMEKISNKVGLKPKELKIRNFKRAWGNCSSKKVISINKDLCKYSIDAIDYVCLHEICHLRYMNHSKDFWNMVRTYMPNYKQIEKELK